MAERSQKLATIGDLRLYVATAVFIGVVVVYFIIVAQQAARVDELRAGCETANKSRVVELLQQDALVNNAQNRAASDDPNVAAEGRSALARAHVVRKRMIHVVEPKLIPGSVIRDCDAALGKPFPYNLFD